ncbi:MULTISPECIES: hypothetical protein [Cysteiniphilum]|uniref:hypothetical protein n=1 Tax=Cysteiniphilum TaxID=2056696 RepID=UPI0017801F4F|nr:MULTISPECIES: hypothetical protein [Cysteiniphilum]
MKAKNINRANSRDLQRDMFSYQLAKSKYDAGNGVPNRADILGNTANKLADDLQGRNARGHGATAKAFLRGFSGGAMGASAQQRGKELEKFNKVMDYLSAVNASAQAQNEQFSLQEQNKQVLSDLFTSKMTKLSQENGANFEDLSPEVRENFYQTMFSNYKDLTGANDQYIGTTDNGNSIIYKNGETGLPEIFDISEYKFNQNPDYAKYQQKNKDQNLRESEIDLNRKRYDPSHAYSLESAKQQAKIEQTKLPEIQQQGHHAEKAINTIERMQDIAEKYPEIFNSEMLVSQLKGQKDPSLRDAISQKVARNIVGRTEAKGFADAVSEMYKLQSDLAIDGVKGLGSSANQQVDKMIFDSTPNLGMTYKAFMNQTNNYLKRYSDEVNRINKDVKRIKHGQAGDSMIKVRHKATGKIGNIPASKFNPDLLEMIYNG